MTKNEFEPDHIEYLDALAEVIDLMRKETLTEEESTFLDDLTDWIVFYENIVWPIYLPTEEAAKEFRRDQESMN